MYSHTRSIVSGLVVFVALAASSVNAAVLITPTVADVSSELVSFGRQAVHAVDSSGLTGTGAAGSAALTWPRRT